MSIQVVLVIVIVLLAMIAVVGGVLLYIYWGLVQRPTPKPSDRMQVAGLDKEVEILLDKHGIPYIYAQAENDLFYAHGFLHARDRLWQMEQNRRIARGTMSEVFGVTTLDVDRFSRIIGFQRAAKEEAAQLDEA